MRQPTSHAQEFAWWRAALAGDPVAYHEDEVHAGFYKRRFVPRGPFVPASIWIERELCPETGELTGDEHFACEVGGVPCDPVEEWTYLSKRPITKEEYLTLAAEAYVS